MNRKLSRIAIMKILFAMEHRDEFSREVMESFFESEWEKSEVELISTKVENNSRKKPDAINPLGEEEISYIREKIDVYLEHQAHIDEVIASNLKDWTMDRLALVDLSILRVAVFEFLYCDDIASAVSVNEAVNIAKLFSTKDSARFINGILGYILRNQ